MIEMDDHECDSHILVKLVHDPRVWADEEIVREFGQQARDSLWRLHRDGLAHRNDGLSWATIAAIRAEQLAM